MSGLNDLVHYAGGMCVERFGVPHWRMYKESSIPETYVRPGPARYVDRDGVVRLAADDRLRVEYFDVDGDGVFEVPAIVTEDSAFNEVLWSRDLTNAAWTKTNCTAVLDQVGADGESNLATRLTATAGNATCQQAIASAGDQQRAASAFVRRISGAGVVEMTMDGGGSWTEIELTGAWKRFALPLQTLANPTVGFRITTSGDEIAVDFAQEEPDGSVSSLMPSDGAQGSRVAATLTLPRRVGREALSIFVDIVEDGFFGNTRLVQLGEAFTNPELYLRAEPTGYRLRHSDSSGAVVSPSGLTIPQRLERVRLLCTLYADGSIQLHQRIGTGGVETTGRSAGLDMIDGWSGPDIGVNSLSIGPVHLVALKVIRGNPSFAVAESLVPGLS